MRRCGNTRASSGLPQTYLQFVSPTTSEIACACSRRGILLVGGKSDHYKIVGPIYVKIRTVVNRYGSNMMGTEGCRDWEEWDLTEVDTNLC